MATRYQVHLPPMAIGYLPVPPTTTGTRRLAFLALTDIFFFLLLVFLLTDISFPGMCLLWRTGPPCCWPILELIGTLECRVRFLLKELEKKQSNPSILSNGLPLFKELYKKQSYPSILSNGLLLFKELQETKQSILRNGLLLFKEL